MESFGWFILACVVVGFIIYVYVASKINSFRQRRKRHARLPDVPPPLVAGRTYNIQLSHGRVISSATIIGMSENMEEQPWELQKWIVAQADDGRLVYLRPNSIRYVEDAYPNATRPTGD